MAKLFGYKDYVCSNGWIDRFKMRHNITFCKISGKSSGVNLETKTIGLIIFGLKFERVTVIKRVMKLAFFIN